MQDNGVLTLPNASHNALDKALSNASHNALDKALFSAYSG